jgi:hypothetical protein
MDGRCLACRQGIASESGKRELAISAFLVVLRWKGRGVFVEKSPSFPPPIFKKNSVRIFDASRARSSYNPKSTDYPIDYLLLYSLLK